MKSMLAQLVQAQVVAHDPPFGIRVAFRTTGQQASFRVLLGRDFGNAVSVSQRPMPQIGSWGLVAFPNQDLRNGVWICAIYPSLLDALTTTKSDGSNPTDPHIDYEAHFSGDWSILDGLGNFAHQYVDSSYFVAASGTALPTVYRHTVDGNQKQQTVPFSYADRIPNPPASGFNYRFHHKSGTDLLLDTSGSVTVSGASGATLKFLFGGSTFMVDASGNTTVSGAAGATLTQTFGHTSFTIDASGLTTLALPGGKTFNVTQGGGSATDAWALVSKLLNVINTHTHKDVQSGSSNSGTITSPVASGDLASTLSKVSN